MLRVLKVLGVAAAAGALKSLADVLPDLLPEQVGAAVAVAVAAAVAYLVPAPKR